MNDLNADKYKHKKEKAQITANELLPVWMYILINGEVDNLLTEIIIIQDFMLKDTSLLNDSGYHLINLITALEQYKNKEGDYPIKYNITPTYVVSQKNNFDSVIYEDIRSLSFSSVHEQRRSESESLLSKLNIFK